METINQTQATRVWQRVRGPLAAEEPLDGILLAMWENASAWAQLSRRLGGQHGATLRSLSRQEQSLCAAVRGVCRVTGSKRPSLPQTPPIQGSTEEILRLSYDRSRQIAAALDARATGELAPIFAHLRELEMEQCLLLLELFGKI